MATTTLPQPASADSKKNLQNGSARQKQNNPSQQEKRKDPFREIKEPIIQRTTACPCGGGCPDCSSVVTGRDLSLQTKLKIGAPNDKYEQEADRIAGQVVSMPAPAKADSAETPLNVSSQEGQIQRQCSECEDDKKDEIIQAKFIDKTAASTQAQESSAPVQPLAAQITPLQSTAPKAALTGSQLRSTAPAASSAGRQPFVQAQSIASEDKIEEEEMPEEAVVQTKSIGAASGDAPSDVFSGVSSLQGGGRSMSQSERSFFEPRFGVDFGGVRIHEGAQAADLAHSINARAFTTGNDIFFGAGQYSPNTSSGQRLMAHELVHVGQQGGGLQREITPAHGSLIQRYSWEEFREDSGINTAVDYGERAIDYGEQAVDTVVGYGEEALDSAVSVYHSARDIVINFLENHAPELLAFLRGDIIATVKEHILSGLDYFFNGFGTTVRKKGLNAALSEVFNEAGNTISQIAKELATGDCTSLFAAISTLTDFGMRLMGPAFELIRNLAGKAGDFFNGIWNNLILPGADAIRELAGDAWKWISDQAKWLWNQTAGIREWAGWAWNEFKHYFNIAWGGANDVLDWLKGKAAEAWKIIKQEIEPILGPLKVAAGIFLLFTPMAPVVLIGAGGYGLWQAIGWLRENWDDLEIIVTAREILNQYIIPTIQSGLIWLQGVVESAAEWVNQQVTDIKTSLDNLVTTLGTIPIVQTLTSMVSRLMELISEALNWLKDTFTPVLLDIKQLALDFLHFLQPIAVLITAIVLFPYYPFLLPVVLAGWAWRLTPDCIKPSVIDFWLDSAIWFVQEMPDFEMFGEFWPQARTKIIEALQGLRVMDTETKIEGSNRIAKMMTGEDFMWIVNLMKAAIQMPDHFMGKVQEELVGQDLSQPLPIERLPEDALLAESGMSIDAAAALLNKDHLTDNDVAVDQVAYTTWSPELIEELNIPDGGEVNIEGGMPEEVASPQGVASELAAQEAMPLTGEQNAAAVEQIPEDPEEQLEHLANQKSDISCGDNAKTEEPATAQEVPVSVRQYGPFTAMQRLRYLLNQMGKGIKKWFNCNKRWLIPTLIVAIIALIVLLAVTEGAILGVLATVLEIIAAIMIGVSLVRMTAWLGKYVTFGVAGNIGQSAGALAKALAIGSIELIFALMFSLGPIMKAARSGFKTARGAGRGIGASMRTGAREGVIETGRAARSAFVPGFEATAKVGQSISRSAAATGKNVRKVGDAVIDGGRFVINGMQDGFASGVRSLRRLRRGLSRLRFRGFSMSRRGIFFILWGHFNPKVMIAGGIVNNDVRVPGARGRPGLGMEIPGPGKSKAFVVSRLDTGNSRIVQTINEMDDAIQARLFERLSSAQDDAARHAILSSIDTRRTRSGLELMETVHKEAAALIKAGRGNDARAAARARAFESGRELTSRPFTNIPTRPKHFRGITITPEDSTKFIIHDVDEFIEGIRRAYGSRNPLHPRTEDLIKQHIVGRSDPFSTGIGVPGLHAEIQALNDIFNQLDNLSKPVNLHNIDVATYKLAASTRGPGTQGGPFIACPNCSGILPDEVSVLTGRQ